MKKLIFSMLALFTCGSFFLQAAPAKKTPLPQLPPVRFKGKPIFMIGVYDLARSNAPGHRRLGDVDPELYECGVNSAFFGNLGMPDNKRYPGYSHIKKAFERARKDPRFNELALIINFAGGIYCVEDPTLTGSSRRKFRPLNAEERKEREKFLAEAMSYFAQQPNVIGYSLDEPENTFTNYVRTRYPQKDIDHVMSHALIEFISWIKPVIDKNHPGALQMPIIAWWGTYKHVGSLYDVLIANQYPRGKDSNMPEFSAPLYQVSFDAARAVAAARQVGNGKTVVYMPPSFNNLKGNWTFPTRKEMRYLYFAPVSRGAMGIMAWRLNRCKQQYRDEVVYPSLKELSRFKDFYLGTWLDHMVSSNYDTATADYLKNFSKRDELLSDVKEGAQLKVLDYVPDVTYCLRRSADNRYMLLVVSNRREALKNVRLTVDFPLPATVREEINGKMINVKGNVIEEDFAPFDVKVYVWDKKK